MIIRFFKFVCRSIISLFKRRVVKSSDVEDILLFINVRRIQLGFFSNQKIPIEDAQNANAILKRWKARSKNVLITGKDFHGEVAYVLCDGFTKQPENQSSGSNIILKSSISRLQMLLGSKKKKNSNEVFGELDYKTVLEFINKKFFIEIPVDFKLEEYARGIQEHRLASILSEVFESADSLNDIAVLFEYYLKNTPSEFFDPISKSSISGLGQSLPNSTKDVLPLGNNNSNFEINTTFCLEEDPSLSGVGAWSKVPGWRTTTNRNPITTNPTEEKFVPHLKNCSSSSQDEKIIDSKAVQQVSTEKNPETSKEQKLVSSSLVNNLPSSSNSQNGWVWKPPAKDLPPPTGADWKNDFDGYCKSIDFKNGKIIGAVVRGRSHKQNAVFCDDSFDFFMANDNWQIVVVSDGVGSALLSRFGSHIAVKAATEKLANELENIDFKSAPISDVQTKENSHRLYPKIRQAFYDAFKAAKIAINEQKDHDNNSAAGENRRSVDKILRGDPENERNAKRIQLAGPGRLIEVLEKDYACTLLAFAVTDAEYEKPDGQKVVGKIIVSCAVGDGMMGVLRKPNLQPNALELMFGADGGQYHGQVVPLTSFPMEEDVIFSRTRIDFVANVVAVVGMTDGVADDYNLIPSPIGLQQFACDLMINGILPVEGFSADLTASKLKEFNKLLADRVLNAEMEIKKLNAQKNATRSLDDKFVIDQKINVLDQIAGAKNIVDLFRLEVPLLDPSSGASAQTIKYIKPFIDLTNKKASDIISDPDFLKVVLEAAPKIDPSPYRSSVNFPTGVDRDAVLLKLWLNYYTIPGSNDDRTLVMLKFNGGPNA